MKRLADYAWRHLEWVALVTGHTMDACQVAPRSERSKAELPSSHERQEVDVIITDPPYYDAIPYSDLMDFFYVWLRRSLHGLAPDFDEAVL